MTFNLNMGWKPFLLAIIILLITNREKVAVVVADVKKNATFDDVVQDAFEVTKDQLDKIVYAKMENGANDYQQWHEQPRQFKRG
jgi:hypothetical protein